MSIITEEWLKEIGFKWYDAERSPRRWLLWLGNCVAENRSFGRSSSFEDFGIEISRWRDDENVWALFYRADYASRYSRFIFVRDVWEQSQLIQMIEAITGIPFNKDDVLYGTLYRPEQAAYFRKQDQERYDRVLALEGRWRDDEKDITKAVKK